MFIASQILVIIGIIIDLIGRTLKNKKLILLFMVVASIFYILSYVLLKNPLAATANGIALGRYIWYLYLDKKQKRFKNYLLPIFVINIIFIVCFIFLAKEPLDIILVVSMLDLSIGLAFSNMKVVRLFIISNGVIWAIYNSIHGAYGNFACDVLNIVVTFGALLYYENKNNSKEQNMKTVVLASGNKHKIKEIQEMFSQNEKTKDYKVVPMSQIGFDADIEETGETYEENARIKVDAICDFLEQKGLNYAVMSDDSGLCVDALDGRPGVYSARYAGEPVDYQANRDKLLAELNGKQNRDAHFVCCIIFRDGCNELVSIGQTDGRVLEQETGNKEFCYDCLFYSNDLKKSFGESTEDEKNSVSHRGRAVENLIKML